MPDTTDIILTPHRRMVLDRLVRGEGAYNGLAASRRRALTRAVNWLNAKGLVDGWYRPTELARQVLDDGS